MAERKENVLWVAIDRDYEISISSRRPRRCSDWNGCWLVSDKGAYMGGENTAALQILTGIDFEVPKGCVGALYKLTITKTTIYFELIETYGD